MSPLHIYNASAGAGKTHALVSNYLRLGLRAPDAFKGILAVTFTNQATQEMKHRIISYLDELAQGKESILFKELTATGWEPKKLQQRAQVVRSNILHQYNYLSVSTIDSFFHTLLQSFTRELGLQYGCAIEMDHQYVFSNIIDQILAEGGKNKQLQQWLTHFATHQLQNGKNWELTKELATIAKTLFSVPFQQQEQALTSCIHDPKKLYGFVHELQKIITYFTTTLQVLGQEALAAIEAAQLCIADFAYGKSGVMGYLVGLSKQKIQPPTQRAVLASTNLNGWYSKQSPHKESIIQLVQEKLGAILNNGIDYYEEHHRTYQTAVVVHQFIYSVGIITHLLAHLQHYKTEHNVLFMAEAATLLRPIMTTNSLPFLYEKIGNTYHHFLIDEFQDISLPQWYNLKPFIANSISQGNDNFIVGDVKQSIYRWRGSDWRLLTHQVADEIGETDINYLTHNRRSSKHIIQFNNTFFAEAAQKVVYFLDEQLIDIADQTLVKKLQEQIKQLEKSYARVGQEVPLHREAKNPGYVHVAFIGDGMDADAGTTISWKGEVAAQLPARIEQLQDEGYALQDIAILVRNHTEAHTIANRLRTYAQSAPREKNYKYDCIAATSLQVGSSSFVQLLVKALAYLMDPDSSLIQGELCYLYHSLTETTPFLWHYYHFQNKQEGLFPIAKILPTCFIKEQKILHQLPLYECIERLVTIFNCHSIADIVHLQNFQDLVLSFMHQKQGGIPAFLTWWQEAGKTTPLPAAQQVGAIRIMTIHQSKGLQFKVVILPFCDWDFDHNPKKSPILWRDTTQKPFTSFPPLPIQYSKKLIDTHYAHDYYEEQQQVYLDNLNLLYVAFTRPEEGLYLLTKKDEGEDKKLSTVSTLLYQLFTASQPNVEHINYTGTDRLLWSNFWDKTNETLTIGSPRGLQAATTVPVVHSSRQFTSYITEEWHPIFPLKLDTLAHLPKDTYRSMRINYGQLMHQLLAHIHYTDDLDDALALLQARQGLAEEEVQQLTEQVASLWHNEVVKNWFNKVWEVKREAPIMLPTGKIICPDRVMLQEKKTVIVDFKTGISQKKYVQQVETYVQALKAMGYNNVQGYLLYTQNGKLVAC